MNPSYMPFYEGVIGLCSADDLFPELPKANRVQKVVQDLDPFVTNSEDLPCATAIPLEGLDTEVLDQFLAEVQLSLEVQTVPVVLDTNHRLATPPPVPFKDIDPPQLASTDVSNRDITPIEVVQAKTIRVKKYVKDHPVAAEWCVKKNGPLPADLTCGSGRKVYWKCSSDPSHPKWRAAIIDRCKRIKPTGCPECYNERRRKRESSSGLSRVTKKRRT
ncbi:MAG: hypothetical protein S4CHLAM81_03530 [Chlamydiales bacterium]|nr:hypothetical protein [Chlamydiales bacterium]MCH9635143.1 hypothetical protein [Chlamydiales bacterium]MCH9703931.1 zinc-ribbon domain-containing protein [Chlamydiota bacterium]